MLGKLDYFLFGPDSQQIKKTIMNSSKEVVHVNLSKLLGSVYFVKPGENIDIAALLNQLDTQPGGRKPMAPVDYVLGGPSLLASTDTHRKNFHGIFMRSLSRPTDYIQFVLESLKTHLQTKDQFNLKDMVAPPIRQAITRGLFGVTEQSDEFNQAIEALSKANIDMGKEFSTEIRQILVGIHYPYLLNKALSWLAYFAQKQYAENIQKFIQLQSEIILKDLHQYAEGKLITNVISLSIIELIKEENGLWRDDREELNSHLKEMTMNDLSPYLENKFIRTLPGMMVASDSIMAIVTGTLSALAKNQKLLTKLRLEIQKEKFTSDGTVLAMKNKMDENKKNGGLLHRIYLEALRLRSLEESINDKPFNSGVVWRYTDRAINLNGDQIPARSTIAVLTAFYFYDEKYWPSPGSFKPSRFKEKETGGLNKTLALSIHGVFSKGHGACPASIISEYLFKAIITHIITNYNFDIKLTQEQNRTNSRISLKPLKKDDLQVNKDEEQQLVAQLTM